MKETPSSNTERNLILRQTINEIGMAIDHVIVRIKQNEKLKKIFSVDIGYTPGPHTNALDTLSLADTWQPDGKAHFRLTNWLNETVYQFVLEQE